MSSVAVIGAGINGAGVAWELARRGYAVSLFERDQAGSGTSSKSSKLIHGGLRYLEHGHLRLVRESLRERRFLLERFPDLVKPIELIFPVYEGDRRAAVVIGMGLTLYDRIAGNSTLPRHRKLSRDEAAARSRLRSDGLRAAFSYYDATVDDRLLVERVVEEARLSGATVETQRAVASIALHDDRVDVAFIEGGVQSFDVVVNATGPWASQLLQRSGIASAYSLSLVRGSHLVVDRPARDHGIYVQSRADARFIFVLPWKGKTLIGTTEVAQGEPEPVAASDEEIVYLLERYNDAFTDCITRNEVVATFAGLRALVGKSGDLSALSRESVIEATGRVVSVFGGKLTTFMALARRVSTVVDRIA
jgi:glycerol-3-phosphate dehydrogenase